MCPPGSTLTPPGSEAPSQLPLAPAWPHHSSDLELTLLLSISHPAWESHLVWKPISTASFPSIPLIVGAAIVSVHFGSVAQSCPTLCNCTDCSLPGSIVHGISQARIVEGIAISFSRGSSPPRNPTRVSCIAGGFFTIWATKEPPLS